MKNPTDDKALLNAILDATVDSIILSDETGTIIRVNTTACTMFGYSESELIGQNVKIIMPAEYAIAHDGYMKTHLETGVRKIIGKGRDVEGQIKDGKTFPLHLSVGRTEIGGKPVFVSILHDLTQRKAAQAALARSQRLDAIGQMTGGVAHDFNNLLTVVIGNLELLEMRGVGANQQALISDALDAAQLGADLTSRLMIFARKSNLAPIRSDLREVCEDALAILKRTLGSSFTIKIDFADDLKPVMIDPVQFQSALMNLALNARDAMGDKGELLISVTNVCIDDSYMAQEIDIKPGDYVRLSVSDDGDGMSPETQKHAFEPFFTTKTDSGGTGLGLAMVHGFVRQSGGHVTLYSEPGLGTSIGLYFPALSQSAEALPDTAPKSIDPGRPAPGRGETVLVVEDNPKVRKLTVERIRDLGFNVKAAENGEDAYAMLKSGVQPDILFSDLVMPGALNGYDLAAKANAEYPNVKVLLTSGYASDVVTSGMAHDRLYDILHKPYRQSDLANRLQALLSEDSDG